MEGDSGLQLPESLHPHPSLKVSSLCVLCQVIGQQPQLVSLPATKEPSGLNLLPSAQEDKKGPTQDRVLGVRAGTEGFQRRPPTPGTTLPKGGQLQRVGANMTHHPDILGWARLTSMSDP